MGGPNILVVDDAEDVLEVVTKILRQAGYRSQPAISGDIALIMLQEGLRFRLLITDIVLPGLLDGFALARRAREFCPGIPIIYTTAYLPVARVRARGAPHGEVLAKPWRAQILLTMVASLLGEQSAADLEAVAC
jgi:CheY-like chemotaxis protein